MALVGVEHLGRPAAPVIRRVGAQRADAADAEQQLLAQPVLAVAAVQPVGDVAEWLGVAPRRRCRAAAAAPGRPGRPRSGRPARRRRAPRSRPCARRAVGLAQQRDRQPVGVEDRVGLLLPALAGERLLEVAVPVEQADADDRHAEVAGRLEVVAGEDAEAAGVLRQHGGDAELGREVARSRAGASRAGLALVPAVAGQVARRGRRWASPQPLEEAARRRPARSSRAAADGAEEPDRVVAGGLPQLGVDGARRRPGSPGARTTAGCWPGRPAAARARAGRDGR